MSSVPTPDTLEESRGHSGFVRSAEPEVLSTSYDWGNLMTIVL